MSTLASRTEAATLQNPPHHGRAECRLLQLAAQLDEAERGTHDESELYAKLWTISDEALGGCGLGGWLNGAQRWLDNRVETAKDDARENGERFYPFLAREAVAFELMRGLQDAMKRHGVVL